MIPKPFAVAIDDLGWMSGHNEGYLNQGPFRLGINRLMSIDDYLPIIEIAKQMNIRLQGLFVLGELDREGAMSKYKTIVPEISNWYSTTCTEQLAVMDTVKANSAFLEFGLHGVSHEFWPQGSAHFKRAEWYNLEDKQPWSESSIRDHLDCFIDIMNQYNLSKSHGHSFPKSFVPCAYSYYWNPNPKDGEYSLGEILAEYGVEYANTDFSKIPECKPPIDAGMDNGLHVMNRYNYGNLWYELSKTPTTPLEFQNTEYIETHWANFLSQDTFLQNRAISDWLTYFKSVNADKNRYCAKNTPEMHSQFLYKKYCRLYSNGSAWIIDNREMPDSKDHTDKLQGLVIKMLKSGDEKNQSFLLNNVQIPAYFCDKNYLYLFLPKLKSKLYELNICENPDKIKDIIWHDTTNNIFELRVEAKAIHISAQFFGKQFLTVETKRQIVNITSQHSQLIVHSWSQSELGCKIEIEATDIQGVEGSIILTV